MSKEKTIVLALAIQLFIAGFSSFLLVGLVSLYDPGSIAGGGITIGVAGEGSDDLAETIEAGESWRLVQYSDESVARGAFKRGHADAVLIANPRSDGVIEVEALVPDQSVRSTMIVVQVRDALEAFERNRRASLDESLSRQPVPVPEVPDSAPTFGFTYTVLLPLLMFLPAFISGSIAADAITEEIDAGTLDLLRVTPLSAIEIVDGKMLAMIALAPAQAAVWIGLLRLNGTTLLNPIPILGLVTGGTVILVALGTGLALLLSDRQSTQLVYSLGVLVLFAAAALLPASPPNAIAKLAIGSQDTWSYGLVLGCLLMAVVAYLFVRSLVPQRVPS